MVHRHSPAKRLARFHRAVEKGFIRPSPPPRIDPAEVALEARVATIRASLRVQRHHCRVSGRSHHFAAHAALAARDEVGDDAFRQARRLHKAAGRAKHAHLLRDFQRDPWERRTRHAATPPGDPPPDPLWHNDPWAAGGTLPERASPRTPPLRGVAHQHGSVDEARSAAVPPPSSGGLRADAPEYIPAEPMPSVGLAASDVMAATLAQLRADLDDLRSMVDTIEREARLQDVLRDQQQQQLQQQLQQTTESLVKTGMQQTMDEFQPLIHGILERHLEQLPPLITQIVEVMLVPGRAAAGRADPPSPPSVGSPVGARRAGPTLPRVEDPDMGPESLAVFQALFSSLGAPELESMHTTIDLDGNADDGADATVTPPPYALPSLDGGVWEGSNVDDDDDDDPNDASDDEALVDVVVKSLIGADADDDDAVASDATADAIGKKATSSTMLA